MPIEPDIVFARFRFDQPRRARIHLQAASQPGEHALDQPFRRDEMPQLVADIVDHPLLPEQPPVGQCHAPMLERAIDRREQPIDVERLGHERERLQLVRRNRGGQRRGGGNHDDLGVGRMRLDRANDVESRVRAQHEVDQRNVERA